MSETESESENESGLDFSASEDEYIPPGEGDSDSDEDDDVDDGESSSEEPSSSKVISKIQQKRSTRKNTEDENDSDSSVENYLVNPNEIDLGSDFFNPNKIIESNVPPDFDCNVGLNLSDSEEEIFEAVPSTSRDAAAKVLDFNAHENFNKDLENAKEQLRNFKSTNFGQDNCEVDVTKLLAICEPSLVAKKSAKPKRKEVSVSTDESDFEEVEEGIKPSKREDVEVRIGPAIKKKPDKYQSEIEASIKRKINRRKKETQLMMHKVHLLSWIAYGNFVNKVLNSTKLMEMIVKIIPSEKSYPKDQTDVKYFEQITKWYKTTVGLKNKEQNCSLINLPPIATSLALQIQSKMAICKKDFVFIFIILLRSIGIQCRLVINLATVPIRPLAKDLCVISTKSSDTAPKEKKSTKKGEESSSDKNKEKDTKASKPKTKVDKLKSRANSISGKISEILPKSPETSNQKKTTILAAVKNSEHSSSDKQKNLKRSVSVQSISSVNDNTKRSRITSSNDSKMSTVPSNEVRKKTLKQRGMSLQGSPSIGTVSKMSLNNQLTKTKSANNVAVASPVARRTRAAFTRSGRSSSVNANATKTSQSIPQFDGGNDTKSKKQKPPELRTRSVSPSSSSSQTKPRSTSVVPRGRTKSNLIRIRLPSVSRSLSKSPTSTSTSDIGYISRRSKIPKTGSNDLSPTSKTNNIRSVEEKKTGEKRVRSSSKSCQPSTSKAAVTEDALIALSPVKLELSSGKKLSSDSQGQKKKIEKVKALPGRSLSKASKLSTSKAAVTEDAPLASPVKLELSSGKKLSSDSQGQKKKIEKVKGEPGQSLSKASKLSTSKAAVKADASSSLSPVKLALNFDIKNSSSTKDSTSDPKPKSSSRTVTSSTSAPSVATAASKKKSTKTVEKPTINTLKRKSTNSTSSDSDFVPTPKKKLSPNKPLPKRVNQLKKRIDRRILSTDDESIEPSVKKNDMNYWIEVYCEAESKWICIDLFKVKVNCVDEIKKKATKPVAYVLAWNNNNKMKDVSPRYCSQWNTTTRKLRVQPEWLEEAISRYKEPLSQRCVAEDRELEEIHAQTPIPTSISEFKNHPLYVLPRHLLKFEGIYPPNPVPVAFIRDEPIYSRLCVHTLHSRELWVKQARVVKLGEEPYKIVKARPKWDRLANKMLEPLPLEIFGRWQTGPYIPPTAENGIVPRNAYGNVELFKPEMLPKKTVHLRLAGLNRVCAKLKIDCAQAVVGFDFHGGSSHPTFDGFVVCEEFAELVTERWCEDQEESYRKSKEKQNQKIYDNWKKLVKGLIIRERLQRKYNFAGKDASGASTS